MAADSSLLEKTSLRRFIALTDYPGPVVSVDGADGLVGEVHSLSHYLEDVAHGAPQCPFRISADSNYMKGKILSVSRKDIVKII